MAERQIEQLFFSIPPVTRFYVSACFATTLFTHLEIVSPLSLYLNYHAVFHQFEYWRLITNFLWLSPFGISFVLNIYFLLQYSRSLEDSSFSRRSADYLFMLLFGAGFLLTISLINYLYPFMSGQLFLGPCLSFMVLYLWGRRNPHSVLSLFGLLQFNAPFLPWVFLIFAYLLGQSISSDLMGILAGHIYYFFEDVYPKYYPERKILKTPSVVMFLFNAISGTPTAPLH